jgi:O-antigen biosynthesis alpha-1,3-mannosyltransferase
VPDQPFALCVGTIEPRKNHATLLRAWPALPAPRPLLLVVGGIGWQCDAIVAALRAAVATGTVRWLPQATDATLWRLMHRARLLVYPSLWEGFGLPPLEAMQIGLPVVAHDCEPMQELGDGALLLADANDPTALAAAIERALRDEAWRRQASAAGSARAATFRWRESARRHATIYREVAGC